MSVIGQDKLIKEVGKIFEIFKNSNGEIAPHFWLTGTSGSGKSYTIQTMCAKYDMNFLEVDSASITKNGCSGQSLERVFAPLRDYPDKPTVIFMDEIDKLFISDNEGSVANSVTIGVQNELLKVIECNKTLTLGDFGKYVETNVSSTLFIMAGAFNGKEEICAQDLFQFGVKTELLGRVPLIYNTSELKLDHLYQILENSELLEMYLTLFGSVDKREVIDTIKSKLCEIHTNNVIGARIVNSLIHKFFVSGGKLDEEAEALTFDTEMSLD